MSWVRDLLGVYWRVLRRAAELAVRHWWLGLVVIAYHLAFGGVVVVVSSLRLGLAGGFLLAIAGAALMSSALVLLGHVVREGRVTLGDIPGSFVVYLGEVMTFFFLLWAMRFVAGIAFAELAFAAIVFELAIVVFLSAVPEEIYLGHESGAAVFVESYKFVAAHWIEWLPAVGVLVVLWRLASTLPPPLVADVAGAIVLAGMGIARGLLFLELTTSSRRAREYRRRLAE